MLSQADPQWLGWRLVAAAFLLNGELESALEVADAALEDARRRAEPLAFATASYVRGLPLLWQGKVTDALADLELARDARRYGWQEFARSAAAHYALCLIERGQLDQAQDVLAEDGPLDEPQDLEDVLRLYSLAELRLAQSRPKDALEAAWRSATSASGPSASSATARGAPPPPRPLLLVGERARASRSPATRSPAPNGPMSFTSGSAPVGSSVCAEPGAKGIRNLRAAVRLGADAPPRLETMRALVDLGAALRRENRRTEAREPLERASDMASRGGLLALSERARIELAAAGARPRREALLSAARVADPGERRIAELAATGQSNREIAQALFVTPKTVEYHLRNAYRKLDIQTRGNWRKRSHKGRTRVGSCGRPGRRRPGYFKKPFVISHHQLRL